MISWSAYHASHQALPPTESDVCLTSMLPLFHDSTNSVAMICHAMNVVKNAVEDSLMDFHLRKQRSLSTPRGLHIRLVIAGDRW